VSLVHALYRVASYNVLGLLPAGSVLVQWRRSWQAGPNGGSVLFICTTVIVCPLTRILPGIAAVVHLLLLHFQPSCCCFLY
jgi:hypothetical protein